MRLLQSCALYGAFRYRIKLHQKGGLETSAAHLVLKEEETGICDDF